LDLRFGVTYDDIIRRGTWGGKRGDMYKRMAEYKVDGVRLGGIDWPTRSGSRNDRRLETRANEILGAAMIVGLLGVENVSIRSLEPAGTQLESPDFDVTFSDGRTIGFEAADVVATRQGQHQSETEALRSAILDLGASDPTFDSAFGNHYISVFLSGPFTKNHQIGKTERLAIQGEIEAFIRSGGHVTGRTGSRFSVTYPTLHSRGATWHSSASPVRAFEVGHSAGNGVGDPAVADIVRVLDSHRSSAVKYRKLPLWIGLIVTDRWDFFRDTLNAVAASPPSVAPFERCYLADDSGRLLELRPNAPPAFVGTFAPSPP
jgi:hypothetical protein